MINIFIIKEKAMYVFAYIAFFVVIIIQRGVPFEEEIFYSVGYNYFGFGGLLDFLYDYLSGKGYFGLYSGNF